jgi:hypothetical protein
MGIISAPLIPDHYSTDSTADCNYLILDPAVFALKRASILDDVGAANASGNKACVTKISLVPVTKSRSIMAARFHIPSAVSSTVNGPRVRGTASKLNHGWCAMMFALLILWGGLTAILIVLLIYRGTLTMHEDDQLFLDSAEAHMQKEQEELMAKMDKITPWVRILGACSAGLITLIAGTYFFTHLTR